MSVERQQLEAAISALEGQRALLGDAIVDTALVAMRAKLGAVSATEPRAQSLRLVTVLFLDVVGSTTLGQHLDPEETHVVMDGAFARFTAIVKSYGGKVLNYAGDSLLAVFGADDAREDDPERAVRAGLALLEEGRYQGELVKCRHGRSGFNVRVGLHTGGVLLGGGVLAESGIRGQAVNVAARMEQTAPAGGLRISHDTYRHVRGIFEAERQPPLHVKGLDGPVVTYLVKRAKPRSFRRAARGIEGVETCMVGRDSELEEVQNAFRRLYKERKLVVVTVVAEAGIGKSRLLYEFQNWAEAGPETFHTFQSRANPQTQRQPYGLLRDIVAWHLRISDSDSMETAKRKIEEGVAPLFAADDGDDMAQAHAHLLGHLIGLEFMESRHIRGIRDDGKQIRNRAFHAAAQMFRRVAAQNDTPVVLLLDDLHWADDGSMDFLDYLMEVNRDVPILLLSLTRPSLFERRPDWPGTANARRIDVRPLDKGFSDLLANELLKNLPEIPAALRELITGGAEGNPFYMEELVKMLVDRGAIETRDDGWTVRSDKLLATNVPQTLTGVLQARLDNLKAAEKLALQQASVIGFVFWDGALAFIDARAPEALPGMTRRELVVAQQGAGLEGVREYTFHHQLLHHVTYDTVLKRMRRDCHAKAAAWLAGLAGARANDFLGMAAEHFEQAGDAAQAGEYFTRAAEHAAGRYAREATVGYVARALALIGEDERADNLLLRWRLLDVRERTLDLQGQRLEQQADIAKLQRLADTLDDDARRGEVAWRRCDLALRTADYRTMESAARQAMALAERVGNVALQLRAQVRLAIALYLQGDAAAGKALAQSGLIAARARGFRHAEAKFTNALSYIAGRQDDLIVGLEMDQQSLLINRELGDRLNEAISLGNLGLAWLNLGENTRAQRDLEEGLRLARAVGDRATESYPLVNLSLLAWRRNDHPAALEHARSAVNNAVTVQDSRSEVGAQFYLGNAELALGHHAAAAAAFERARAVALAIDDVQYNDAAAGLARVALAKSDVAAALLAVEDVLSKIALGGTLVGTEAPQLIRLTCFQVLTRARDPRAAEMLAIAHTELCTRAATITDSNLRHSFLNNIPEHRAIVAAWTTSEASSQGGG